MVKTFIITSIMFSTLIFAKESSELLKKNCLACHTKQKIPSELIYRRYLLKYSTHDRIKEQLITYLKTPTRKTSIMPKQFFLKFPEKEALDLNGTILKQSIDAYLEYFDIKNKLILK
jgi:hypothetical protein